MTHLVWGREPEIDFFIFVFLTGHDNSKVIPFTAL